MGVVDTDRQRSVVAVIKNGKPVNGVSCLCSNVRVLAVCVAGCCSTRKFVFSDVLRAVCAPSILSKPRQKKLPRRGSCDGDSDTTRRRSVCVGGSKHSRSLSAQTTTTTTTTTYCAIANIRQPVRCMHINIRMMSCMNCSACVDTPAMNRSFVSSSAKIRNQFTTCCSSSSQTSTRAPTIERGEDEADSNGRQAGIKQARAA